jgi:multisubunit Na+/H+ antiporter MnhB subunit
MFFDIGSGEVIGIVAVLGVAALGVGALVRSFRRPRA